MTCSYCDFKNEDGVFYCRGCRAIVGADYDDIGLPEENDRVLVLAQACELVSRGEWSPPEFHQYLSEFVEDQQRREAGVHGVEIPFGLEEDFAEEREVGFRGVDACNRALQILSSYDPEVTGEYLLLEALHMFNNGMCGVKEAMKINRRSYGRPLWL